MSKSAAENQLKEIFDVNKINIEDEDWKTNLRAYNFKIERQRFKVLSDNGISERNLLKLKGGEFDCDYVIIYNTINTDTKDAKRDGWILEEKKWFQNLGDDVKQPSQMYAKVGKERQLDKEDFTKRLREIIENIPGKDVPVIIEARKIYAVCFKCRLQCNKRLFVPDERLNKALLDFQREFSFCRADQRQRGRNFFHKRLMFQLHGRSADAFNMALDAVACVLGGCGQFFKRTFFGLLRIFPRVCGFGLFHLGPVCDDLRQIFCNICVDILEVFFNRRLIQIHSVYSPLIFAPVGAYFETGRTARFSILSRSLIICLVYASVSAYFKASLGTSRPPCLWSS